MIFRESDLIKEDVPYAGALTLQATWYAFNDDEFRGFEITAGVVGPPSLAEQTQKTVHKLIGSSNPKGWDHQLDTEPVINFNYMRKRKIWRRGDPAGLSFDTAINGNVGLGNLVTQASTALEMRFGHNMPRGFVYVPDPIGWSMHYKALLRPANPRAASFYATLVLRGSAFAHNIFLDGNTFSDSHSVDKEPLAGQAIAGLHYERENWGIHLNVLISSDDVDTSKAPAAEGQERLGTIDVVAGTTSMKLSDGFTRLLPSVLLAVFYLFSLAALALALKRIDVSVAYAVWAGVGTVLVAVVGILWFQEPVSLLKVGSILLIAAGVVGLHLGGAGQEG